MQRKFAAHCVAVTLEAIPELSIVDYDRKSAKIT
jgi:hypothetical protein